MDGIPNELGQKRAGYNTWPSAGMVQVLSNVTAFPASEYNTMSCPPEAAALRAPTSDYSNMVVWTAFTHNARAAGQGNASLRAGGPGSRANTGGRAASACCFCFLAAAATGCRGGLVTLIGCRGATQSAGRVHAGSLHAEHLGKGPTPAHCVQPVKKTQIKKTEPNQENRTQSRTPNPIKKTEPKRACEDRAAPPPSTCERQQD